MEPKYAPLQISTHSAGISVAEYRKILERKLSILNIATNCNQWGSFGIALCDYLRAEVEGELTSFIDVPNEGVVMLRAVYVPMAPPVFQAVEHPTQARDYTDWREKRIVDLTESIQQVEAQLALIEEQRKDSPPELQANLTMGVSIMSGNLRELERERRALEAQV